VQRSTKLHLSALGIAATGLGIFAVPLWIIKDISYAGALAVLGLTLIFIGVLSGLGFGALGRARNRAAMNEDATYRRSLGAKQPWQQ
jgi:hypothetical protein